MMMQPAKKHKKSGVPGAHSIDQVSQSDEKSIAIKSNALVNRIKADSFANRKEDNSQN